jgi:AcrR family transcriptional regulator
MGQRSHGYHEGVPRWEPDARERLAYAALQLFSEKGYDDTTVAEIADRAGLTKSTFFRYFPDKRDVLTAGTATLSRLFEVGISEAPADATPLQAVGDGLERAASAMGPINREFAPRLQAMVAASAELQERHALKQVGFVAAMAGALRERGVADSVASVAAELGGLAFKEAYAEWAAGDGESDMGELSRAALERLRRTVTELG